MSHTELLPTYQHTLLSVLILLHYKAQSVTALEQVVDLLFACFKAQSTTALEQVVDLCW